MNLEPRALSRSMGMGDDTNSPQSVPEHSATGVYPPPTPANIPKIPTGSLTGLLRDLLALCSPSHGSTLNLANYDLYIETYNALETF